MVPGCCSDDFGSYKEGLGLLPSHVVGPKRGDGCPLSSQPPKAFQFPVVSLAVVMKSLVPVLIDLGGNPGVPIIGTQASSCPAAPLWGSPLFYAYDHLLIDY